jgi:hypothetical protein
MSGVRNPQRPLNFRLFRSLSALGGEFRKTVTDTDFHPGTPRTDRFVGFASALDWPGWCRRGKDQARAIVASMDNSARYAVVAVTHSLRTRWRSSVELQVIGVRILALERLAPRGGTPCWSPACQLARSLCHPGMCMTGS